MKLNRLLASVRSALLDDGLRMAYAERIYAPSEFFDWINFLNDERFDVFFTDFAGQGRVRWHYGLSHSLLCSFEDSFMSEHGRGWLPENNANQAKTFVCTCPNSAQDNFGKHIGPFYIRDQSYS